MLPFAGLAGSLYPYLVPSAITIADGTSASGTPVLMPVYNGYQYLVLDGEVSREYGETSAQQEGSRGLS
ncbi:MAG: hypothetical protein WAL92_01415 [Thiogranum sp.]